MRGLCVSVLIVLVASDEQILITGRHACTESGCWPSTWLLGCQKCGSTSLSALLHEAHVSCYANVTGVNDGKLSFYRKETHFWDGATSGDVMDWKYFVELYPKQWSMQCESFMDATPGYLSRVEIAPLLSRTMPLAVRSMSRMVAVLREPIARDLSSYNHQVFKSTDWKRLCKATKAGSFEDMSRCDLEVYRRYVRQDDIVSEDPDRILHGFAVLRKQLCESSIWGSLYVLHLRGWMRYFYRSQFFVISFEQLFLESEGMDALFSFVRSKPVLGDEFSFEIPHANSKSSPNKQYTIDCATVDALNAEIYDRWNEELYSMLADDRESGRASPLEPAFRPFDKFPCTENKL